MLAALPGSNLAGEARNERRLKAPLSLKCSVRAGPFTEPEPARHLFLQPDRRLLLEPWTT